MRLCLCLAQALSQDALQTAKQYTNAALFKRGTGSISRQIKAARLAYDAQKLGLSVVKVENMRATKDFALRRARAAPITLDAAKELVPQIAAPFTKVSLVSPGHACMTLHTFTLTLTLTITLIPTSHRWLRHAATSLRTPSSNGLPRRRCGRGSLKFAPGLRTASASGE